MEEKAIKDMEIDELIEIYRNSGNTKKKEILEEGEEKGRAAQCSSETAAVEEHGEARGCGWS